MNRRVKKFYMADPDLKRAIKEGKDVYAAFASKLFNCDYEECLESRDNKPNLAGLYRRKVAKTLLCAMYFSTKKKWHKAAFETLGIFETYSKDDLPFNFRSEV
jgi:hypothetical protein